MSRTYSQDHCSAVVRVTVLIIITLTILYAVNASTASAQSGILFQKTWVGVGTAVAVDSSDNIYVTGNSPVPSNFTTQNWVLLSKYDSTGTLIWQRAWSGDFNSTNSPSAIAVDVSGNICVVGLTSGLPFTNNNDIFILKFDASGSLVWQRTYGSSGNDEGFGVAVDSSGNIYVTGSIAESDGVSNDVLLLKLNSSGNLLWQKTWGGIHSDSGKSVAVDSSGDIYVTGTTTESSFGTALSYLFLLRFNSSGSLIWQKAWGPTQQRFATGNGVAVDSMGSVYVTGYYSGRKGTDNILDVLLLRFDSAGSLVWQRTWDSGSWDRAEGVAVDSSGGIYVTGSVLVPSRGYNVLLAKFDSSGDHAGIVTLGSNALGSSQKGNGVGADSSGYAVVTGFVDYPPLTLEYPNGTLEAPSFGLITPNFTLDTPTIPLNTPSGAVQITAGSEDISRGDAFLVKFMPISYTENLVSVSTVPPIVIFGLVEGVVIFVGALTIILLRRRKKSP